MGIVSKRNRISKNQVPKHYRRSAIQRVGNFTFQHGFFSAGEICLQETAINDRILRVSLEDDFLDNYQFANGTYRPYATSDSMMDLLQVTGSHPHQPQPATPQPVVKKTVGRKRKSNVMNTPIGAMINDSTQNLSVSNSLPPLAKRARRSPNTYKHLNNPSLIAKDLKNSDTQKPATTVGTRGAVNARQPVVTAGKGESRRGRPPGRGAAARSANNLAEFSSRISPATTISSSPTNSAAPDAMHSMPLNVHSNTLPTESFKPLQKPTMPTQKRRGPKTKSSIVEDTHSDTSALPDIPHRTVHREPDLLLPMMRRKKLKRLKNEFIVETFHINNFHVNDNRTPSENVISEQGIAGLQIKQEYSSEEEVVTNSTTYEWNAKHQSAAIHKMSAVADPTKLIKGSSQKLYKKSTTLNSIDREQRSPDDSYMHSSLKRSVLSNSDTFSSKGRMHLRRSRSKKVHYADSNDTGALLNDYDDEFGTFRVNNLRRETSTPLAKGVDRRQASTAYHKSISSKTSGRHPVHFRNRYGIYVPSDTMSSSDGGGASIKTAVDTSKLDFPFLELVDKVKCMKLPSKDWVVKFLVHKNVILFVSITNNKTPERSVTFASKSSFYKVVIEAKKVILLGSPQTIDTIQDVEILVDITHKLHSNDSVLKCIG